MPELPDATRTRLQTGYGLSTRDVDVLMSADSGRDVKFDGNLARGAVAYFDDLCAGGKDRDPKVVVNWYLPSFCGSLAVF
jgi:aspartyl-tRNA(Asn)/glutamyl-tRNA(Gln) amidotransferase subunit B